MQDTRGSVRVVYEFVRKGIPNKVTRKVSKRVMRISMEKPLYQSKMWVELDSRKETNEDEDDSPKNDDLFDDEKFLFKEDTCGFLWS